MKEITFTDEDMDSLLLIVSYLKDSEQKHYMENIECYDKDYRHDENDLDHIYVHVKKIEQVLMEHTTNL